MIKTKLFITYLMVLLTTVVCLTFANSSIGNAKARINDIISISVNGSNLHYISFNIATVAFRIIGPANDKSVANFLLVKSAKPNLIALINGGYLKSYFPPRPLGMVRINNINLTDAVNTWIGAGMVCFNKGKVYIGDFNSNIVNSYRDCLQSGPLIINNGKSRYDGRDFSKGESLLLKSKQEQSFICLGKNNNIIIGYSDELLLQDLTNVLQNNIGCNQALRLSGSDTAGIVIKGKLFGNSTLPLHNAIGVFAK